MLEKGRTGLADVWRQGRDGECCWNCLKLLTTEETTFGGGLRPAERDKDVDRPIEIDTAGPQSSPWDIGAWEHTLRQGVQTQNPTQTKQLK